MNQDNNSDDLLNLFSSSSVLNEKNSSVNDSVNVLNNSNVQVADSSNFESNSVNALETNLNNSVVKSVDDSSNVENVIPQGSNIVSNVEPSPNVENVIPQENNTMSNAPLVSSTSLTNDTQAVNDASLNSSASEGNSNNNLSNGPMPELEEIDDDQLLISFVGKNADKILYKRFNFAGFFFSFLYMFYRKMFLYGLGVFLINLIVLNVYYNPIIILLFNIAVGIEVNKIYRKHAVNKINIIKTNHPFGKMDDLKRECHIQGGTNGGFVFVGILISVGLGFLLVIILSIFGIHNGFMAMINGGLTNGVYSGVLIYDTDNKADDLFSIAIPDKFEKDDSFDTYSYSSGEGVFDKCEFSLKPIAGFSDASNLITQMHDYYATDSEVSNVLSVKYNGIEWSYFTGDFIATTYYYATSKNGKVYLFEYDIDRDADDMCEKYKDDIITSIKNK